MTLERQHQSSGSFMINSKRPKKNMVATKVSFMLSN